MTSIVGLGAWRWQRQVPVRRYVGWPARARRFGRLSECRLL